MRANLLLDTLIQPKRLRVLDFAFPLVLVVLAAYLIFFSKGSLFSKKKLDTSLLKSKKTNTQASRSRPIKESIRQIGLISKDEFASLYLPIIERVEFYEQFIGNSQISEDYFRVVYKSLRKKRSVIFESGHAERNNEYLAHWTYALFLTISVRYVAQLLDAYSWSVAGVPVDIYVTKDASLTCTTRELKPNQDNKFNPSRSHLIPSFTTPEMIGALTAGGMYRFVVCSISGGYYDPHNPFYKLIDEVEGHVRDVELSDKQRFISGVQDAVGFLGTQHTDKNTLLSLTFNGKGSFFIVEKKLLWSLFLSSYVFEQKPPSYSQFIEGLHDHFALRLDQKRNYLYTIEFSSENDLDEFGSPQLISVELPNMLALPYSEFPNYVARERVKIKKHFVERDVTIMDAGSLVADQLLDQGPESAPEYHDVSLFDQGGGGSSPSEPGIELDKKSIRTAQGRLFDKN